MGRYKIFDPLHQLATHQYECCTAVSSHSVQRGHMSSLSEREEYLLNSNNHSKNSKYPNYYRTTNKALQSCKTQYQSCSILH